MRFYVDQQVKVKIKKDINVDMAPPGRAREGYRSGQDRLGQFCRPKSQFHFVDINVQYAIRH